MNPNRQAFPPFRRLRFSLSPRQWRERKTDVIYYNDDKGINPSTARPIPMCQKFYRLQDGVNRISYNLVYEFRSSVRDSNLSSVIIFILFKSKTFLLVVFD